MAGGEPRLGTTATYMRHNDHGTTRLSTEIDRLHDRLDNEYRVFSAGSVRKWSKFGLSRHCTPRLADAVCLSIIASSRKLVEQRLRLFEIGRIEAFGEPAVDRGEKVAGFGVTALVAAQP